MQKIIDFFNQPIDEYQAGLFILAIMLDLLWAISLIAFVIQTLIVKKKGIENINNNDIWLDKLRFLYVFFISITVIMIAIMSIPMFIMKKEYTIVFPMITILSLIPNFVFIHKFKAIRKAIFQTNKKLSKELAIHLYPKLFLFSVLAMTIYDIVISIFAFGFI